MLSDVKKYASDVVQVRVLTYFQDLPSKMTGFQVHQGHRPPTCSFFFWLFGKDEGAAGRQTCMYVCMYVMYVCHVCRSCMYVMYVGHACMSCMHVMYVCDICMLCVCVCVYIYIHTHMCVCVFARLVPIMGSR